MDRDTELRIAGHCYEIEAANDKGLGHRQGFANALEAYERTLEHVAECAGVDVVDELAERIKDRLEDKGERPSNRQIRRRARRLVSEAGYPADEYLNRA